jgi:hypothetical protein
MTLLNRPLLAAVGVIALAGSAVAQKHPHPVPAHGLPAAIKHGDVVVAQPVTNPVVVTQPITNPTVLRAITPTQTGFIPGYYTPPGWGYNPWTGPVAWPGTFTPPAVVQNSPGQFLRLPDGKVWNPTTGTFYSPWFNTFSGANGTYYPNTWTGTYVNPLNGASFNPLTNIVTRPYLWGTSIFGNPWAY